MGLGQRGKAATLPGGDRAEEHEAARGGTGPVQGHGLCQGHGAMQSPVAGAAPQELPTLILEATKELEVAKQQVLKRIQIWKRQQQLAGNGAVFEENLAPLQKRWGGNGGPAATLLPRLLPRERRPCWPEGLQDCCGPVLAQGALFLQFPCRCESLVEVYFQLHQQVMAASTELGPELLPRLLERFNEVLSSLVKR